MFSKKDAFSNGVEHVDTIIGKDTALKGSLQAIGTLRIDGHFEGELATQGNVVVGESGIVKANIKARGCTIAGEVTGDICTGQKLEIVSSGKLKGNIQCENLIIGEGAIFHGTCEMRNGAAALTEEDAE